MPYEIIVIGTSLGGLDALQSLLGGLPADFLLPIAIVQHRSAESDLSGLIVLLQRHSKLPVSEAEDKETILPGRVYVAPADYHLLVDCGFRISDFGLNDIRSTIRNWFALSIAPPVLFARPSIDVLFESAADAYRDRVIGVILTGASEDGANGAAKIKARGGLVVVQDPASAVSRTMPESVIAETQPDYILRLEEITRLLIEKSTGG